MSRFQGHFYFLMSLHRERNDTMTTTTTTKKRRLNGEGSVYRNGTGWRGQLALGSARLSFSGKTKSDVIRQMAEARTDYNRGKLVFKSSVTVIEWVTVWLEKRKKPKLEEQSYIRLKALYDNHLLPAIGDCPLQDLTRELLEEKYAEIFKVKIGKDYKETTYAHSTVNALSSSFKECLAYAVTKKILIENPHEGVELHKLRPPKKVGAHTREDQKKIVEFTKNNGSLYWIYYLLIATGMRFGEAAALTWDDVDLNARTIHICKTSVELHGSPHIQDHPKTSAGNRTIAISGSVAAFLKMVKESQAPDLNYRNLVMPNTRYNIISAANTRKRWQRVCAILGIEYQGVHALRHTWATRAFEEGIDVKTVSAMLGHKNVITTMNIYQDVLPDYREKAVKKLDALL